MYFDIFGLNCTESFQNLLGMLDFKSIRVEILICEQHNDQFKLDTLFQFDEDRIEEAVMTRYQLSL